MNTVHKKFELPRKIPNIPGNIAEILSGNWQHTDPSKQFAKQDMSPSSMRVLQITERCKKINKAH
jgi:hypothetical protein